MFPLRTVWEGYGMPRLGLMIGVMSLCVRVHLQRCIYTHTELHSEPYRPLHLYALVMQEPL